MNKKVALLSIIISLIICLAVATGAYAGIAGSRHDLSSSGSITDPAKFGGRFLYPDNEPVTEICVFCHTPHHARSGSDAVLWNRTGQQMSNYTPYTSTTLSVSVPSGAPSGLSLMCMSCHDGITSLAANVAGTTQILLNRPNYNGQSNPSLVYNPEDIAYTQGNIGEVMNEGFVPIAGWGANIGNNNGQIGNTINMSNDHPVSFDWLTSNNGIKSAPSDNRLRLFGTAPGRMECSTCHNVHDNTTYPPFLVMSNGGSAMCLACHNK